MHLLFFLNHSYKGYTKFSKISKKCSQLKKKKIKIFDIGTWKKKNLRQCIQCHYNNNIPISNGHI